MLYVTYCEVNKLKIMKVKNYEELSELAANMFVDKIKKIEKPVVGLATGSTPEGMYANLIKKYQAGEISFANVVTFNLDEYAGLSKDNPMSYQYFMHQHLFHGVDIKPENIHIPNGLAEDLDKECEQYEELIQKEGKIDVQLLGLGLNGHIGFNEPGTPFDSRTHVVELEESTRIANSRFFNSLDEVPKKALTMGIGTIMEAKEIIFIVNGEKKADILRKVVHGDITEEVPASILQRHPNITLITDIDL